MPKLTLAIIFAASMVVSHYSLGFIGFIYMGLFLPLVFTIRSNIFRKAWSWMTSKLGGLPKNLLSRQPTPAKVLIILVVVYFVVGFAWYGAIASGVNLSLVSRLWTQQATSITTTITTAPSTTEVPAFIQFGQRDVLIQTALGLDFPQASPQGKGFRVFQYITELFLIVGCLRLIFNPKRLRFTSEYIALSVTSALLILACIFLPGFAPALNTTRWYHITLITLAPFCILGGEAIWLGISSIWHRLRHAVHKAVAGKAEDNQAYLKFVALAVLIPYFLFTAGFVYEVTGDRVTDKIDAPYSIALSSYRLDLAGVFYWRDGAAAQWLSQRASSEDTVYGDGHNGRMLELYKFPGKREQLPLDANKLKSDSYIYLTAWNTAEKEVTYCVGPGLRCYVSFSDIIDLTNSLYDKNRVYDNGGAQVFAPR
jgi:uncharacterized membrane protein